MRYPEFAFRMGTQDQLVIAEVMVEDNYKLPEYFEPTDVVVDIGANIGAFSVMCLSRGCGALMMVEPHPENFSLAVRNTAYWKQRVTAIQAAVYFPGHRFVRLQDRGENGAMHTLVFDGTGMMVPSASLDELLPESGRVRLLKLDCEGGEYPALMSAKRLGIVDELIVEVHPVKTDGDSVDESTILRVLADNHFEVTNRVVVDPTGPQTVIWARNTR